MELLQECIAQIHHSGRQGYYKAMETAALGGLEKFPGEPTLSLYLSISLLLQKKAPDALRKLQPLHSTPKVSMAAVSASIDGHRACTDVDQEELASLEARAKELRKSGKPEESYYTGVYFYFCGKPETAVSHLDRAIKQSNGQLMDAISLRAWVDLNPNLNPKEKNRKSPIELFESVLKSNRKHIDANLGAAFYYQYSKQFDQGIEKLVSLLGYYPKWIPPLEEKMKFALCMQEWDQALELADRIIAMQPSNLEALRFKIIYSLCREGDMAAVEKSLDKFYIISKENEPNNARHFYENARLFSRLGSYNKEILTKSLKLAKFATEVELDSHEAITEVGWIYLLMQKYKEGLQEFKAAVSINPSSPSAILGMVSSKLVDGDIAFAEQQLEFFKVSSQTSEVDQMPGEYLYLSALIAKRKNKEAEKVLTFLNNAADNHFREVRRHPFNITYLKLLNPDLIIKIVRENLLFAPQEPATPGMQPSAVVRKASIILDSVLKVCPSHRDALFISAQTKYLSGDMNSASLILNQILKIDTTLLDGYLLKAQIHTSKEEWKEASQTLEDALSSNFKVRDHPKYLLLLARIDRQFGDSEKALQSTKDALNIVKSSNTSLGKDDEEIPFEFGQLEVLSLYQEHIACLRALEKFEEANRVLEEAYREFKGTHLDGQLALIQAEEFVNSGEIEKAIEFLQKIQPGENNFVESRKLLAEIILEYKRDKNMYTTCFMEIVNQNSTAANLVMLGDAYISVHDHEKALEVYEIALSKNPKDYALASKMGQAFVSTHQFQKAINYYREAIKAEENFPMRLDLATLHMKLKQWDKAEKTLAQALSDLKDPSLTGLMMEANILCLLGKVQQGAGNSHQAQQSLIKAKESQSRVLKRTILEQPTYLVKQKLQFALICKQLGEIVEKPNDIEFAIRNLKEALTLCPGDSQLLTTLSKLYLKVDDQVNCQQYCEQLLQVKPECLDANVMLGELYFRHYHDFSKAAQYFQQILDINPAHFSTLEWCIECARRNGKLSEAEPYVKAAANRCDPEDPGYCFCVGLFEWYNGNANAAVKMLNNARRDQGFGQKAVLLMIDIYLSPYFGLTGDSEESKLNSEAKETNINIAETLVGDLTTRTPEDKFRRQVLDCLVLIATRNKNKIEKALTELTGLSMTDPGRDSVMLVYALASGNNFVKQIPRARNQLKRTLRSNWCFEDAEYLEGCWLLSAEGYIQSSKYDLATDLIRKVLMYNKGCGKANELLGFIMEKEQAYADAAADYDQAWKLTNCTNSTLGYKLAFNYLKAKRYPDAIDVCHVVLAKNPNYPKIRKEILEKARANLRV